MYGCRCCTSLFQYRMLVSLLGGDVVLAPRNNVMIPSNHIPKQACIQKAPGGCFVDDPELSRGVSPHVQGYLKVDKVYLSIVSTSRLLGICICLCDYLRGDTSYPLHFTHMEVRISSM